MAVKVNTLRGLQNEIKRNPALQDEFRQDPVAAIEKVNNPLDDDYWIYRIVVLALGLTLVLIVVGVIVLMFFDVVKEDKNIPTLLTATGSAAIGALAGLLAPSPRET